MGEGFSVLGNAEKCEAKKSTNGGDVAVAHLSQELQAQLPALIAAIYEASLEPARWQAFMLRFGAALRSPASIIWVNDFAQHSVDLDAGLGSFGASHGFAEADLNSFAQHYCQRNVWLQDESLHQAGMVVNSSELFADARLPSTEWFGDWLRPQDLFYSCAAVVEKQQDRSFNVTLLRARGEGGYSAQELGLVQALMPHLQTAFAIHRRLCRTQALQSASLAVLEALPMGVLLIDEKAELLHCNQKAAELMAHSQLLARTAGDGLRAASPADDRWLQKALHDCTTTGLGLAAHAGRASRFKGLAGQQLQVMVAPLPRNVSPYGEHCAAMVLISDPAQGVPSLQKAFSGLYQFTQAEARLAQSLIAGLSLQECAELLGVSIHTVRSQFKSAAAKVGVGRQADFVRVLLTGPAMLRMP